jgi:putative ATP-dependent endonuclease of OLD family
MNEGFFADVVVLVEGESDRAAILEIATTLCPNLEGIGISVIPCMSKNNLAKPTAIFKKLEISVYVIWDSDYGNNNAKRINHILLRLFGQPTEDWPEKVTGQFTCFKQNLTETLRSELGENLFDSTLETLRSRLYLDRDAVKNPQVIQEIIKEAQKQGKSSKTLEKIISKIVALRGPEALVEGE